MKLRLGRFELGLMIVSLALLHILDVYTTVSFGGLEAEGNVIAAYIWTSVGLHAIIGIKVLSIGVFTFNWVFFGLMQWGWVFRLTQSIGLIGLLMFTVVRNLAVIWRVT